jgi:exoribonuclease R
MEHAMRLRLDAPAQRTVAEGLDRIRRAFDVPQQFPAEVMREADDVVAGNLDVALDDRLDVPLQTLDPAHSRDLDQAFAIAPRGRGYRVFYAVADVGAIVRPGGALDREARERGVTLYLPDGRVSLYPEKLSEGVASLLPGQQTPALLWTIDLAGDGTNRAVDVRRALVRSRAKLSYGPAQGDLDRGTAGEQVRLLARVGALLRDREVARGGVSLDLPDQEVVTGDAGYGLVFERPRAVERHNAQLSLSTGMAAAQVMLGGDAGLLRTLPQAGDERLAALRDAGAELGHPWEPERSYGDWIRSIDAAQPSGVALLTQALRAFRGAGYAGFRGAPPAHHGHAAVAAPYAHVTAPLRRLADRFANQVVLDIAAGREVSAWVDEALDDLPGVMARATQRASAIDRAVVDLVESVMLEAHVGATFPAIAVDRRGDSTVIHLLDPAVVAELADAPDIPLGTRLDVRLAAADPTAGTVTFTLA